MLCKFFDALVRKGAADNDVDVLAQHVCEVGHRFPISPANVLTQKQAATTQVGSWPIRN